MAKFKIGLVFSDTGGGHRSATDAIQSAIQEIVAADSHGHDFEIISDNVVEKTHPINRAFVDFYNYLLRNNQSLMKYYYSFIHLTRPNDSEIGYRCSGPYLENWLKRELPQVLISVHPMSNQYFVRALHETGMFGKVKLITVVTDPSNDIWRGWACPEADLTVVPNELTGNQLIKWGVDPARVKTLGMPVHPDFVKPPSVTKIDFRNHLGLHPDRLTVCINAGWAGGGNMLAIYRELARVRRPVQALFLCGHNKLLYAQAKKASRQSPIPSAVLPFHDRMADLMAAVDLMVTKAGGLTTFEAIARRLPMAFDLITPPMPQEAGNVRIVIEQGLAQPIVQPHDIVDIVENFTSKADRKLPTAYQLDRTDAVYDIARAALCYCDPAFAPAPIEEIAKVEQFSIGE